MSSQTELKQSLEIVVVDRVTFADRRLTPTAEVTLSQLQQQISAL